MNPQETGASDLEIPADILRPGVRVVIVGSAKSVASARAGHYYAHPSNRFWHLLQATGLTGGRWIPHTEDRTVLEHGVGLTDVVPARAESNDARITAADLDLPGFVAKMERLRPRVVAFNGGASSNSVSRYLGHGAMAMGPADWTLAGAATYRLPSSSARHATGGYAAKEAAWAEFGRWVRNRPDPVGED
jgi:TDG/mug DNA glycosylase family protein